MATFDYTEIIEVADELTAEFGRAVTFRADDVTPADPNQPWDGGGSTETTVELNAVFVPPNTVRQFGVTALGQGTEFMDMLQMSEQMLSSTKVITIFATLTISTIQDLVAGRSSVFRSFAQQTTIFLSFVAVRR